MMKVREDLRFRIILHGLRRRNQGIPLVELRREYLKPYGKSTSHKTWNKCQLCYRNWMLHGYPCQEQSPRIYNRTKYSLGT